jgi:DnaD/phage-associated family protein
MAGRPPKKRIDFAGWSVDMFDSDSKIDKLLDSQGWVGFGVWFFLCQRAYGTEGYYYRWGYDDSFTTAKKMGGGVSSGAVTEAVKRCLQIGLFDEGLFDRWNVLTSRGIQKRYYVVIAERPVKNVIGDYWLLSEADAPGVIKCTIKSNLSPTNTHLSPTNADLSDQKESKEKYMYTPSSSLPAGEDDEDTPFGKVQIDQGWQSVCSHYMDNLGNLPMGIALDDLQELYDRAGEELTCKAITETARSQPKSPLRYLCTTLRKWLESGIQTTQQVNAEKITFKRTGCLPASMPEDDPLKGYTWEE